MSGRTQEELVVITKTYDLILWSCNHTGKFPRNHRFVLGERIERNLYDLLELLIRAKSCHASLGTRGRLKPPMLRPWATRATGPVPRPGVPPCSGFVHPASGN